MCERTRRRQQCSIATQHDDQRGPLSRQQRTIHAGKAQISRGVCVEQRFVVMALEPCDQFRQKICDLWLLRLGDNGGLEHYQ